MEFEWDVTVRISFFRSSPDPKRGNLSIVLIHDKRFVRTVLPGFIHRAKFLGDFLSVFARYHVCHRYSTRLNQTCQNLLLAKRNRSELIIVLGLETLKGGDDPIL